MDDLGGGIGAFENASLEQYEGCLLGLAMGDALGAPIEFLQLEQIPDRRHVAPKILPSLYPHLFPDLLHRGLRPFF